MANGILNLAAGLQGAFDKAYGAYTTERDYLDKKAESEEERKYKQGLLKQSQEQKAYERAKAEKELGLKESTAANEMLAKGFIKDPESGSYVRTPESQRMEELKAKKLQRDANEPYKLSADKEEKIKPSLASLDPDKIKVAYEKLPAEAKKQVGLAISGLKNVEKLNQQLELGQKRSFLNPETPLIGGLIQSTPIDESTNLAAEAFGRLRSGGAINKDEEKRFKSMLPTAADTDPQVRSRKLENAKEEFLNALEAQGLREQQLSALGYDTKGLGLQRMPIAGLINEPSKTLDVSIPIASAETKAPKAETQMINGQLYQKIQGGWKRVKK